MLNTIQSLLEGTQNPHGQRACVYAQRVQGLVEDLASVQSEMVHELKECRQTL
jgi:hypothetical protein